MVAALYGFRRIVGIEFSSDASRARRSATSRSSSGTPSCKGTSSAPRRRRGLHNQARSDAVLHVQPVRCRDDGARPRQHPRLDRARASPGLAALSTLSQHETIERARIFRRTGGSRSVVRNSASPPTNKAAGHASFPSRAVVTTRWTASLGGKLNQVCPVSVVATLTSACCARQDQSGGPVRGVAQRRTRGNAAPAGGPGTCWTSADSSSLQGPYGTVGYFPHAVERRLVAAGLATSLESHPESG